MRFGSVCSGIEAASVAWGPLGWEAAWVSEIEPFPSAVLAQHYPSVPNLGDMTTLPDRILSGEVEAPDLFCGGTPCQAFSVAGLRRSLDDARGNLSLTFCEIADAIDHVRLAGGKPASIVFWENVPGVLNTADNAFGCFLGALAGCDSAIVPSGRWTDAGVVAGPQRTVAWRTLDAQYFGLAQRRRRVFVVASARDGFDPAQVLLEFEGVRRDSAPSREAGKGVARGAAPSFGIRSANTSSNGWGIQRELTHTLDTASPQIVAQAFGGGQNCAETDVSTALSAHPGGSRLDFQTETFVTHTLGTQCSWATEDETGRGSPLVPMHRDVAPTLTSNYGKQPDSSDTSAGPMLVPVPMINMQGSKGNAVAQADGPSFTLNAMHGHDMHAVAVPVAVPDVAGTMKACKDSGGWSNSADHAAAGYMLPVGVFQDSEYGVQQYDSAGTLRAGRIPEHQMVMQPVAAGAHAPAVAVLAFDPKQIAHPANHSRPKIGDPCHPLRAVANCEPAILAFSSKDHGADATADLAPTLRAMNNADSHANGGGQMAVAFTQNSRSEVRHIGGDGQIVGALAADSGAQQQNYVATAVAVRTANTSANGHGISAELAHTLDQAQGQAVAIDTYNQTEQDTAHTIRSVAGMEGVPATYTAMQVRRLTPVECERLQGFPDGYTAIPWRGKPVSECPDGPRYKALGNSWAVPVVRWIGRRIHAAL